jgi:hypothetical protein
MVLPDAWLIHLPHSYTPAARLFGAGGKVKVTGSPPAAKSDTQHSQQAQHNSQSTPTIHDRTQQNITAAEQKTGTKSTQTPGNSSSVGNRTRQHRLMQQDAATADFTEGLAAAWDTQHLPEVSDIFGWRPGVGGVPPALSQYSSKASALRHMLGLLTQGGASVPVTTDDPAAAQQVQEFYKHVWHLGAFSFNTCPMPASYSPVLSRDVIALLHELPWWQMYSYK